MSEIDDLLKNLKKNPSSRRIKIDAQTYLDSLKEGKSNEVATLDATLEAMNQEIQKDFGISSPLLDPLSAFDGLEEWVNQKVLGQKAYVLNLSTALKRPFITGKKDLLNTLLICGNKGIGKHLALQECVCFLYQKKLLASDQMACIEGSLYQNSDDEKIWLQDLYAAISSHSSIILINHLDQLYSGFSYMITELVQTGQLTLKKRYGLRDSQLTEVNQMLLTTSVSSLKIENKYLVFMSDKSVKQVTSLYGKAFMDHIQDVIEVEDLSEEIYQEILEKKLALFIEQCQKKLNYEVIVEQSMKQFLLNHRQMNLGVLSLQNQIDELYQALTTHKLKNHISTMKVIFTSENNEIIIQLNEVKQPFVHLNPSLVQDELLKIKQELSQIVGLQEVKQYMENLEANVILQQKRQALGLKNASISMHMIFTGNPGTGKTTIARLMARYFKAMGILSSGQLIEVSRKDLVGRYVGHTAPLTHSMIRSALGGILFIDEAYSLYRGKDDHFGLEAIDTLVKGMEDHREDLVVILAGYTKEMNEFLEANSGLRSRFPNRIEFKDYSAEELYEITVSIAKKQDYQIHESCKQPLLTYYALKQSSCSSGNGRLARNKVEEAILNQSRRVLMDDSCAIDELRIEDFDLLDIENP